MSGDDLETALLAAIRTAPDGDDAPLRVYMDWLLERNDPRGNLMLLIAAPRLVRRQLSTSAAARRRAGAGAAARCPRAGAPRREPRRRHARGVRTRQSWSFARGADELQYEAEREDALQISSFKLARMTSTGRQQA